MDLGQIALKKAIALLGEHFDTVQILASRHDIDGTASYHCGLGNSMARYGHAKAWLMREEAAMLKVEHSV